MTLTDSSKQSRYRVLHGHLHDLTQCDLTSDNSLVCKS